MAFGGGDGGSRVLLAWPRYERLAELRRLYREFGAVVAGSGGRLAL